MSEAGTATSSAPARRALATLCGRHAGLLAALLVGILSFYVRSWEGDLHGDPVHYAAIAEYILKTGDWLTMHDAPGVNYFAKPPLMFWLVALNFKLFGASVYAAKFWSCAFGVGVSVLLYLLGRRLFDGTVGLLAALMWATFPGVVPNAIALRLDSAVAFFAVLAVYSAVRAVEGRAAWLLMVGVAAGLGMMAKPYAPLHVFLLAGFIVAWRRPRLMLSVYALGAGVAALLIAAPWHLAMLCVHGRTFLDVYFGREIASGAAPGTHFFANVARYLSVMSYRALPWWPFAVYALGRRHKGARASGYGLTVVVVWFLLALVAVSTPRKVYDRYMIPAYPAVALLSAQGLAGLLPERWRLRAPKVVVGYVVGVTCLLAVVPVQIHSYRCAGFTHARPLLDRLAPGDSIASFLPNETGEPDRSHGPWGLRSKVTFYLDRTCRNYTALDELLASGERFVISRASQEAELRRGGYEPLMSLDGRYILFWPTPAQRSASPAEPQRATPSAPPSD